MKIDLLHNKIVRDTITEKFSESFAENVIPPLFSRYGESLVGVQMYEDYIKDGFTVGNIFYYPLTVVLTDNIVREWISWKVSSSVKFRNYVPFAYVGDAPLEITLAEDVPSEFSDKLYMRGIYFEGGTIPLNIQTVSSDKTFLAGKYSQSFVDELCRQITARIEEEFNVSGAAESGLELLMTFAPETYMEHTVDNVTYRRLLISARGCSPRDFWIKWIRLDGAGAYSVSSHISSDMIRFDIAEDVPQKVREKEYRFLVRSSADKYQSAMGRKNITEWRDIIKRIIKRGELVKNELPLATDSTELTYKLREILGYKEEAPINTSEPEFRDNSDLEALLRASLGVSSVEAEEEEVASEPVAEVSEEVVDTDSETAEIIEISLEKEEGETEKITEEALEEEGSEEEYTEQLDLFAELQNIEADNKSIDIPFDIDEDKTEGAISFADLGADFMQSAEEETEIPASIFDSVIDEIAEDTEEEDTVINEPVPEDKSATSEEELRRKIEEELREKILSEAREKMNAEAEELRREREKLLFENERLMAIARKAEEDRMQESEALRREIQARERAEIREKERLAEAARASIIEQQRIEERKAEEERERIEKEELLRAEIARREEEARIAEERRLEEARIRQDMEARIRAEAEERARAEEEARARAMAEAKIRAEAEARAKAEEEARIRAEAEMRIRLEAEARIRSEAEARAKAEAEARVRAEAAARIKAEAEARIRAEAEARAKAEAEIKARKEREERLKAEELARIQARKEAEARAKAEEEAARREAEKQKYTYVSKTARLVFRRHVDPNITKRIHEIIVTTIKYFHKEDVYIKIKATVPDSTTVNLEFTQIPEEETELLVNIIKVLGKSELGITKVFLE